ncbi:MAG: DNA-3-methyladenine glycosylase 2 family protein [Methanomicrobiales archaeon HGW-Methanomicrobiales-4]|nr:MAG: DNA-3-methyladenine glycosylase 2 family protein [Methanomicrobiales archaeon HGW-Methanomicrobiales-4]
MIIFKYGQRELDYLKKKDKKLGLTIDRIGMIEREVNPDLFSALINSIVSQQISSRAAATVWKRIQNRFGEITPETISSVPVEEIQQCGISTRKSTYIRGIGVAVMERDLVLSELSALSDDEVIRRLSSLNGIGRWTAEMLLIFSMERPDVVSWDDLAIQRGMNVVYGLKELNREQFERYRKRYSPFGSVASLYLWAASTAYHKKGEK